MSLEVFHVRLSPAGPNLEVLSGTPLQEALWPCGVEFPCGGRGRCKGCRVKMLSGQLEVSEDEIRLLAPADLAAGWRLACRHEVNCHLDLELAQWEMPVLDDQSAFPFVPREGLGLAIDLGTTTIAAQLVDLRTGNVLGVSTALNAQARHGGDVMSRIDFARRGGLAALRLIVRHQLGGMVRMLLRPYGPDTESRASRLRRIVIVGNSVMHQIFCGIDVTPLSEHPFEPAKPERFHFSPADLGWDVPKNTLIEFLPCIGGFVGSDILAGIMATGLHVSAEPVALIDLGTNAEVVVGDRNRILCTSTAAGPAFEGARISMGMRAVVGAINSVCVRNGAMKCGVIGGAEPRGLCGSGLVDAVAAGLELNLIEPGGRMTVSPAMNVVGQVTLSPKDVRELQLAKGAIAAGLQLLTTRFGTTIDKLGALYLAGAFGNYISRTGARRIGLLRLAPDRIVPAGNAALHGAKRALFEESESWDAVAQRMVHVLLNEDEGFPDAYAGEMAFPATAF